MKKLLLASTLFLVQYAAAENLIVRFKDAKSLEKLKKNKSIQPWLNVKKVLVQDLNIHLLEIDSKANMSKIINDLRKQPEIKYVQRDHKVTQRAIPNDPEFNKQWAFNDPAQGNDIRALDAWTLGTGGSNRYGQDVVVAVVDSGVDINHQSLKPNIWINQGEIPNNNKDDDGNGYIDDMNGWNAYEGNGKIYPNFHGTHVAGHVGAVGNDGLQSVGVNWNVKIMAVAGATRFTSTVLAAYGYILKQKQIWLQTKGVRGANVVVSNSSFGVDRADCNDKNSEYPVWNDIYDEMGKLGILSVAATANKNVDVDQVGDVPTTCNSEYLIGVTNTTQLGKRYTDGHGAAYGAESVDLGAPGTDILSTMPFDQIGIMTGTSMAAPLVAGAVAFLHNVASEDLADINKQDPAMGALLIKNIILDSVTPLSDLSKTTVTGGMLNLGAATTMASTFKYVVIPTDSKPQFSIRGLWSKLVKRIKNSIQ